MLEPWNNALTLPPPVHTFLSNSKIDVNRMSHACNHIIKVLSKQSPLHQEAAILSRFVYKFDKKFRNDIGYRNLKKVNTALRKYLKLNFLKDVENFKSVLPSDDVRYLPTRQMLEYVLVRLITFSKLMLRIYVCSKQAAVFYLDRVKRGESHWMSLMPYALLSRVCSMSLVLLQHSCTWYKHLYPFLDKLQIKGLKFLPNDYRLPTNLEEWLDIKNLDNLGSFEWSQKKECNVDTPFVEDTEGDRFDDILNYVNEINDDEQFQGEFKLKTLSEQLKTSEPSLQAPTLKNIDQGEVISRESFKEFENFIAAPEKKNKNSIHTIQKVTNKLSLQEFIDNEEKYRNDGRHEALTSHLKFMQWQALKNNLVKLLDTLSNDRKIQKKFYKIWKEKCLIYL